MNVPPKKIRKMEENLFSAAKDVQEAEIEVFKGNDGIDKVFALYEGIIYDIGFLDLFDAEKLHLDECLSTHKHAKFTVDSDEITFTIESFYLNRLRAENVNNQYLQVSNQTSLVKYKDNYYFVHDLLAKDFRRFAFKYGRDAADIAFVIPDSQIKLDADQTLKLSQDAFKKMRKIDMHFGAFEFHAPIRVNDAIKRYVANNSGQIIQIEDHLVKDIKLETAAYKIDIKVSFTPIVISSNSESESTNAIIRPNSNRFQMPSYANIGNVVDHNVPTTSAEVQILTNVWNKREHIVTERKTMYFGLNTIPLKESRVPENIRQIVNDIDNSDTDRTQMDLRRHYDQVKSNENSYLRVMSDCIYMEMAHQQKIVECYNMSGVKLISTDKEDEYHLEIKNRDEFFRLKDAIRTNTVDCFELKPDVGSLNSFRFLQTMKGVIRRTNTNNIRIKIVKNGLSVRENDNYRINFETNTTPFDAQQMALNYVREHKLFPLLIESRTFDEMNTNDHAFIKFNRDDETIDSNLNEEQRTAVEYITKKRESLPPYVLYGPPGTGKTKTLVAAIEKIVKTTEQNVLVCAQTNQACDELTERLMDRIDHNIMLRMYAKTHSTEKVTKKLQKISNIDVETNSFDFPDLTSLYGYRVIICTLCTSNCLTRARKHKLWQCDHFNIVIIDECANTHETAALIPIAGLVTKEGEVCAKIVLAGDPQQLKAVTKSQHALNYGFSKSYLEHLTEMRPYKPSPNYDERFITFLTKNYRSHESIIDVPNELFYESRLVACAPPEITELFIGSDVLISKECPIIIIPSHGTCEKTDNKSSVNYDEIQKVREFVNKLIGSKPPNAKKIITASDIGIISPYLGQCKGLRRAFRNNADLTIGTTEAFQGSEKPVIIISTVRTNGVLGFLEDYRRFNVAITRAKSLLVVVADVQTISKDRNWGRLIEYCRERGVIRTNEK